MHRRARRATAGQELDLKVASVDLPRCRIALSLRAMQADPLRETMDSLQWRESEGALPEIQQVRARLAGGAVGHRAGAGAVRSSRGAAV